VSVVLVTGSTSGIGEATARLFAARGDRVVLNSARSVERGERLAGELPGATYVRANIALEDEVERLVAAVADRHGRLDVLVNNAATTRVIDHRDFASAGRDVWREIFELNVFAAWHLTTRAMDLLREGGGAVVNVSSHAGERTAGSSIPYAASKAALNHMTRLLARVVGPEVRVNAVAPGFVDTPWTADWDAARAYVASHAPLRRVATPQDVAGVIASLVDAPYVTGQVVAVDGGLGTT
jgi:ketoreductase RED2